jgi:serine O-acetyltransferase
VDIQAVYDRDPAYNRFMDPVLYLKGFHAIQTHRLAHWLYHEGRKDFAYYLQSRSSSIFQTDIHPAARLGSGLFLDHATGLVVGETALIEDNIRSSMASRSVARASRAATAIRKSAMAC